MTPELKGSSPTLGVVVNAAACDGGAQGFATNCRCVVVNAAACDAGTQGFVTHSQCVVVNAAACDAGAQGSSPTLCV